MADVHAGFICKACRDEVVALHARIAELEKERDQALADRHAVTRLAVQMKIISATDDMYRTKPR